MACERVHHVESLETLRAAVNAANVGIVLLDRDLRPRFANPAFLRMWHFADQETVASLDFEGFMRLAVAQQASSFPAAKLDAFIKKRAMMIRAGIEDAIDVRLNDGQVIRVTCKPLPDGSRMLTYTEVTDLAQQADKFRELATLDSMTGLFNRRHFLWVAEIEWSRYQRYLRPMSMLMIDIDQFKSLNDCFGHYVGDHVIVQMGNICREQKRKSDVAARFGGDEFLIMLPEASLADAQHTADRLWQQVAAQDFSTSAHAFKVTVSIGVAEAEPNMDSVFDLIKLTDQALYKAKNSGRNRVCAP